MCVMGGGSTQVSIKQLQLYKYMYIHIHRLDLVHAGNVLCVVKKRQMKLQFHCAETQCATPQLLIFDF